MHACRAARTAAVRPLALSLAAVLALGACSSRRIHLREVPLDAVPRLDARATDLRVGIRPLERLESSFYQEALERQIERALVHSGLFRSVLYDEFVPEQVDLVLDVGKADLSVRRQANLAGLPLAILTLGIYVIAAGPVQTDVQFYEVSLRGSRPDGRELFTLTSRTRETHWLHMYSRESRVGDGPCAGPDADRLLADLVRQLDAQVRQAAIAAEPSAR